MRVLVVNAGSSSLKLRLLDEDDLIRSADLPAGTAGIDSDALTGTLQQWGTPDAVGHRVVHGGTVYSGPVVVDAAVRVRLGELTDLAPLHQPKSLAALDAVSAVLADVTAVASFDTAFHTTIPTAAATYAIPREWRERYAIRRYGFHGLSHAYACHRAATMVGRPIGDLRIVTCHLGAGASLAAVVEGRSVDTTMGFTPLEGLVMATRSGTVDPGLVLWLEEHEHLSPHEVATALEERSGLLGLSGSADLREVEAAAARGEPDALLAIAVYVHRLVGSIGAMTASAGGLDVLVFTGGVGEHSSLVRRLSTERLGFLGVSIAATRNSSAGERGGGTDVDVDVDVSSDGASVRTLVISAREDRQIAAEVRALLRPA